jgi:hypothetical protein
VAKRMTSVGISFLWMALVIALGPAPKALAFSCSGQTKMNVEARTTDTNNSLIHYGVKAQIWVPDVDTQPSPTCVRVSSIAVRSTTQVGDTVEIGWLEDPTKSESSFDCNYPLNHTEPRRFGYYDFGTLHSCIVDVNPPPELNPNHVADFYETMSVRETISASNCSPTNNNWRYVDGPDTIDNYEFEFCQGVSVTNGERHAVGCPSNCSDNPRSHFLSLQVFSQGTQTWLDWHDNSRCYDNDPGWDPVFYTDKTKSDVSPGSDPNQSDICLN